MNACHGLRENGYGCDMTPGRLGTMARLHLVVRCLVLGACIAAASVSAAVADKRKPKEMVFSIVRASNPICEPLCPEWIAADGQITGNSTKALKAILKKVGKRNLPLLIHSNGGDVDQAMAMGKIIRKRKMTVEVARPAVEIVGARDRGCKAELPNGIRHGYANTIGAYCYSACSLMMAGGVRRIAGPVSSVGVHQITTQRYEYRNKYKTWSERQKNGKIVKKRKLISRKKVKTTATTKLSKAERKELEAYLTGMGVQAALIDLMMTTRPEDILFLNVDELQAFGVATEIRHYEYLVGYRDCERQTPPDHCTVRP